jgi:hypothetical protein
MAALWPFNIYRQISGAGLPIAYIFSLLYSTIIYNHFAIYNNIRFDDGDKSHRRAASSKRYSGHPPPARSNIYSTPKAFIFLSLCDYTHAQGTHRHALKDRSDISHISTQLGLSNIHLDLYFLPPSAAL